MNKLEYCGHEERNWQLKFTATAEQQSAMRKIRATFIWELQECNLDVFFRITWSTLHHTATGPNPVLDNMESPHLAGFEPVIF